MVEEFALGGLQEEEQSLLGSPQAYSKKERFFFIKFRETRHRLGLPGAGETDILHNHVAIICLAL